MLAEGEESCCSAAMGLWMGSRGVPLFMNAMRERGVDIDPKLASETLQGTLVGAWWLDNDEVNARVEAAADNLMALLVGTGARSARYEAFVRNPQPPRHAVYAGASTRVRGEMAHAELDRNIHYSQFKEQIARRRASGMRSRESHGVAKG